MIEQHHTDRQDEPRPIFKNRPGLIAFLAVLIGFALADQFSIEWRTSIMLLAGSMLVVLVIMYFSAALLRNCAAILLCGTFGVSLYSYATREYESAPLHKFAEHGSQSQVEGIVSEVNETRRGHLLIVDVAQVQKDSIRIPAPGRLALQLGKPLEDAEIPLPEVGDTILIFADLFPLRLERNPYSSTYDERLKYHHKAHAIAEANSRFDYYLRPASSHSVWDGMSGFFRDVRAACDTILRASIADAEASAFVRAVVLGTRGDIPESTVLDFRYSGLTHLLAISGFNIAVVSLLIVQILLLVGIRRRSIRLPVTAISVAFYCLVVGLQPSVLRAFVMVELYILALLIERKSDLANIAALTALIHLIIDPFVIHDPGFQLSYAAVFGFALVQPHLTRLFEPREDSEPHARGFREWLRHSSILSVAAFVTTTPILLLHFQQVSLSVLIANLVAIPLAGVITTLGFIMIPLGYFATSIANIYGEVIDWSVQLLLHFSAWISRIPNGQAIIDMNAGALVGTSALMLWVLHVRTRAMALKRTLIAVCVIAIGVNFIDLGTTPILPKDELAVVFADVGQGDATIVRTPSGRCYMFDFGPFSGADPNFSARPYAALMQVEGLDQIHAGFITHLHRDHYGAAFSAVYSNKLQRIFTVGDRTSDEFAYSLDSLLETRDLRVDRLYAGQSLELEKGVKLHVLAPDSSARADRIDNDRSLVIRLTYGHTSILLLGDVEEVAERELVSKYGEFLRSDVVKVAHHGSISSSTLELVQTADPRYAVISCGRANRFGHPHRSVVSRWLRSGSEVLRTDLDGAIILSSDGNIFRRIAWKQ